MKEIRIHGRGGQGAAVASRILTTAFVNEGKWACGFPLFGVERRGAPVAAFVRFNNKLIRERSRVYNPDCLIVIDSRLFHSPDIFEGIKDGGVLVVNAPDVPKVRFHDNLKIVGSVDATGIGVQEIGMSITNTCMIGAFARTTGWIDLDSVLSALREYFGDEKLERNIRAVTRGFEETSIVKL